MQPLEQSQNLSVQICWHISINFIWFYLMGLRILKESKFKSFFAGCEGFKLHLSLLCSNRGQIPDMWISNSELRCHFGNSQVLENLPPALLYIGAIYAALFLVGSSHHYYWVGLDTCCPTSCSGCVFIRRTFFRFHIVCGKACNCGGRKGFEEKSCSSLTSWHTFWKVGMCERLKAAMTYLVKETFTRKDFYLLWLTRLPSS